MDILQSVRISTIPNKLRVALILLGIGIVVFNVYVIAVGFGGDQFWVAAGAQLLAVILPFSLLAIFIMFAHSGHAALKDRTELFLLQRLPEELLNLSEDCTDSFIHYKRAALLDRVLNRPRRVNKATSSVRISYAFEKGDCYVEYKIDVPEDLRSKDRLVTLRLRVELNVKKANIVLWFAEKHAGSVKDLLQRISNPGKSDVPAGEKDTSSDFSRLGNTLVGANEAGYKINPSPIWREVNGERLIGIVFIKSLCDDFLWNPAEQLFFSQDIMFMLRALVVEACDQASGTNLLR